MAKGNAIVLSSPFGRKVEGTIFGSGVLPGMIVQIKAGESEDGQGRLTYEKATPGGDGQRPLGPLYVVDLDFLQGGNADTEYADGAHVFLWCPHHGDELNVRVSAPGTGTSDNYAVGQPFIIDNSTGMLIATTGTPDAEPFMAIEDIDDVVAGGTLVACVYAGG